VLEYLTEDGLFSIDIALRPPPHQRRQPARPAAARLTPDAPPAADATAADGPSTDVPGEAVPVAADARQSGSGGSHDIPDQMSEARSPAEGGLGHSGGGEPRGPAAGGVLMLQPGFCLKGPHRWRSGRGGVLKSQPSEELRVSLVSTEAVTGCPLHKV
jgi:hypothetical protein